jgi:hypothetical protein
MKRLASICISLILFVLSFEYALATEFGKLPAPVDSNTDDSGPPANNPPRITIRTGIPTGVLPEKGISGDTFRFGFDYDDEDKDPCVRCEVWIDLDGNGSIEESERFPLEAQNTIAGTSASVEYVNYEGDVVIHRTQIESQIRFRFYASDGKDEATIENGTHAKFVTFDENIVNVVAIAILIPNSDEIPETIPGGNVSVEVALAVSYKHAENISFDVDSLVESLKESPLAFGTFSDYTVRSSYHSNSYDRIVFRFNFNVSSDAQNGLHKLELPPLSYFYNDNLENGDTIYNLSKEVRVLPYIVVLPSIDTRVALIGDPIEYSFSVFMGANEESLEDNEVKALKDFDLGMVTVHPFEIKRRDVSKHRYPSGAQKTEYTLSLVYFGVPEQEELVIPSIEVAGKIFDEIPVLIYAVDPPAVIPKTSRQYFDLLEKIDEISTPESYQIPATSTQFATERMYTIVSVIAFILAMYFVGFGGVLSRMFNRERSRGFTRRIVWLKKNYEHAKREYEKKQTMVSLGTYYHSLYAYLRELHGVNYMGPLSEFRILLEKNPDSSFDSSMVSELENIERTYYEKGAV